MLSNNWMRPISDEADREDTAYVIDFPRFKIRRSSAGIWEASKGGITIMALDLYELLAVVKKLEWAE